MPIRGPLIKKQKGGNHTRSHRNIPQMLQNHTKSKHTKHKALMNHKVRLHMDVSHPTPKHSPKKELGDGETIQPISWDSETHICTRTIRTCNVRTCKVSCNGKEKWIQGPILHRSGNVTYVDTESTITILSPSIDQINIHLTARYPIGHFQTTSTIYQRIILRPHRNK